VSSRIFRINRQPCAEAICGGGRCSAGRDRQVVAAQLAAAAVKAGGRLIKHARYYWVLLAESYLTRPLFSSMLRRIATLPSRAGEGVCRAQQISVTRYGGGKGLNFAVCKLPGVGASLNQDFKMEIPD